MQADGGESTLSKVFGQPVTTEVGRHVPEGHVTQKLRVWLFLACQDGGGEGRFDESLSACAFFFFFF